MVANLPSARSRPHLAGDPGLEGSERGIWALKVSLASLLATALLQVIIVVISGSVALLADTIHNFADAGTAIPLWIAFALNRRRRPKGTPITGAKRRTWPASWSSW